MAKTELIAILLVKGKKVLAEVRKGSDDFGAGATWIPGGHIEKDETPERAFLRESKEEFGIKPKQYYLLCRLPWDKGKKKYAIYYFICSKWIGKIKNKEAGKLIWLNEKEVNKLDEKIDQKVFKKYFHNQ